MTEDYHEDYEYFAAKDELLEMEHERDIKFISSTLSALIKEINNEVASIMDDSIKDILSSKSVRQNLKNVFPYLYTVGLLAFTGRPIQRDTMRKVLSAADVESSDYMLDVVASNELHNLTMYMYALYYLLVMGKSVTTDNLTKIVTALGIERDDAAIAHVIQIYGKQQREIIKEKQGSAL